MILTLIVVILGLVAGAVYAVWLSYLEDQADRQAFDRGGPQLLNDTEHVAMTRLARGEVLDRHDRRVAHAAIKRVCGGIAV